MSRREVGEDVPAGDLAEEPVEHQTVVAAREALERLGSPPSPDDFPRFPVPNYVVEIVNRRFGSM